MLKRFWSSAILLCFLSLVNAQTRLSQTLQGYSEAQKRLLVRTMGRFLFMVHQGQWDQDSAVRYACHVYGFSPRFPYDEMIRDASIAEEMQWLDQGQTPEVVAAARQSHGEQRIRLLLELAIHYLYRPGAHSTDLDSAAAYISAARETAGSSTGLENWLKECDALQGALRYQQGDRAGCIPYFASVANSFKRQDRSKRKAMALHQWALHLPFSDSNRIRHLEKAFGLYEELSLKEHAIEVMGDIVTTYFTFNWPYARQKLDEVLALQQAAGYRHTMDTYYVICFLKSVSGDYIGTLSYADSCLTAIRNTGDSLLYSLVCYRQGAVYHDLNEWEHAYIYCRNGMKRRYREPQLFWYNNFLVLRNAMSQYFKPEEVINWMKNISAEFPPEGMLASLQLALNFAVCYQEAGQIKNAEDHFTRLINALDKMPPEHRHATPIEFNVLAARFYYYQQQYDKARDLLEKALRFSHGKASMVNSWRIYNFLYKIDSIEGNYRKAFVHHRQYKIFYDSFANIAQRFKIQELHVKYETLRKDKDIKILTQQGLLKESALQRAEQSRNIILAGLALLAVIAVLLYNQYRVKKKNAELIGQKNSALEQLVDEKQWLLKEIHHRVKNSLQTIVSLLELQTNYPHNDPLSAIQASQNRIFATSLLHQKLYQADNMSSVNMSIYLPELVSYLEDAFQTRGSIRFETAVQPIELDVSQAVPIGIIINEVITNAIKHAFPGETGHDKISISLAMTDADTALLQIADNGKGIPDSDRQEEAEGLGLKLVRGLTTDIDGAVRIVSDTGTTVSIQFKPRLPLTRDRSGQTPAGQPYKAAPHG